MSTFAKITGLCLARHDDGERLRRGEQLFDDLLAYFARLREARRSS
jgi:hypothetical protein